MRKGGGGGGGIIGPTCPEAGGVVRLVRLVVVARPSLPPLDEGDDPLVVSEFRPPPDVLGRDACPPWMGCHMDYTAWLPKWGC